LRPFDDRAREGGRGHGVTYKTDHPGHTFAEGLGVRIGAVAELIHSILDALPGLGGETGTAG
jgi:hypothetical protein